MKAGGPVRKLFGLPPKTIWLLAEAFVYLAWARFLVRLPFSRVAPFLGLAMQDSAFSPLWAHEEQMKQVSFAIRAASRHVFWESKCLDRAIAAMKMLARRRIGSTLYLGTAKGKNGELIAHAWLRSGWVILTGAEEMSKFTVVGKFAKVIDNTKQEGAYDA